MSCQEIPVDVSDPFEPLGHDPHGIIVYTPDGYMSAQLSKPDPEIFLTAAHELGVEPRDAMVLEDAVVGVEAAKAGGMAAIGIARADDADMLAGAGADIVVTTLDDVDTAALAAGRLAMRKT